VRKTGLLRRQNGKYMLTAFRKVIDIQAGVQNAIDNYWNLKAIVSVEVSDRIPREEYERLINTLIDNHKIKYK
jgi:predicted RNA-binding protein with PUA domain